MQKILIAAVTVLAASFSASAAAPTLYGNLIYTRSWGAEDATKAGVYSFPADASGEVTSVFRPEGTNVYGNGGAVYVDGKYYVLTHVPNTGKAQKNTLYTYNADSWTLESQIDAPLTTSANDLTWCPVDNKVYGVFMNTTSSGYVFGTLSLTDGNVDVIKALDLKDNLGPMPILALAADTEGDIYGVAADGDLYRFDRTSGDYTLIGATGFKPARWNQSACFDFTTKEMYWAACNADLSALFKVDTATGAATSVRTFTDDEEFVGLYSLSSVADLKGPQAPEGLAVALEGNALAGKISFTLPAQTISGDKLEGNIDYVVEDNGAEALKGSAAAGSAVSLDITFTEGEHAVVVYATTADGRGASARAAVYAGNDTPATPAGVTAVKDGDKVTVSWTAVTTGFHKGYLDASAVTYTVTRMPGATVIAEGIAATTCTDTELPAAMGDYTYSVSATCAGKTSEAGVSAPVALGEAFEAPLAIDLTKEDEFKFFTVIDANDDEKTWSWSVNGVKCDYHRDNASDDWLISPMINLKAGYQYTIALEMRSGNGRTIETYEIMAGNAPTVEALTIPVLEGGEFANINRTPMSVLFTPETDGAYCFGVHCTSPKYQYSLYVYTFAIAEPVSLKAPVASETVSATAAEAGKLEATVKAVAPDKAVDGSAITALEKAEVTNLTTGKAAGSVANPVPGAEISVTDTEAANGINEYSVVFYNAAGKGYAATTEVYVGEDKPAAVTDVVLKQDGDKAVLTWTAPTEGANGGYINPANLRYRVVDTAKKADVATELEEVTYTDAEQDVEEQHLLQYTVYVSNAAGESTGTASNPLTFGNPYDAPFAESFAGGKETVTPWSTVKEGSGYPSWSASTMSIYDTEDFSQDGDKGWMRYSSKGTITLLTPIVNISNLTNPVLKLWYCSDESTGQGVDFNVLVSGDRGVTWTTAKTMKVDNTEWEALSIDLSGVKTSTEVQIGFKAACDQYQDMFIDNIRIADALNKDLGIVSFSGPATVDAGATATYIVRLSNEGASDASGYSVNVYGGERLLGTTAGEEIAANGAAIVSVDVTFPINFTEENIVAKVDFAGDEFAGNNEASLAVATSQPRLPVIETLAAVNEGNAVRLSWSRPAEERNPSAVTDDLETLTAWDFGGVTAENHAGTIGDYTVYDADGKATVVASSYSMQPNAYEPMAYQVNKTGGRYPEVDLSYYAINAHSGEYSFIAWGADQGESSDWLILPELFSGETTVSFWAHAAPMGYGASPSEKMEILYSTGGTAIDDFTSFAADVEVPSGFDSDPENGFTFFSYQLPAEAKYAAIRVSLSTTMNKAVVIDDITFTPASSPIETLEIKGYNIYRDGEQIGTADTEEYFDTEVSGTPVYNVTTRYHIGESSFSNAASPVVTGVEGVLSGAANGELRFYNLQGLEVKNPAKGNVYIVVRPDGTSFKHFLR